MTCRRWLGGLAAVVALAACGSGGATTSGPATTAGPATTSSPATTGGPATTGAPATTAGPATTNPADALPDPCTLATLEQMEAAVLTAVAKTDEYLVSDQLLGEGRTCEFGATDGGDAVVIISTFSAPADLDAFRDDMATFGAGQEIPGLGDFALQDGNLGCFVVKGDKLAQVSTYPADGLAEDPVPRVIALCGSVVGGL
jgi:hypothetical protein